MGKKKGLEKRAPGRRRWKPSRRLSEKQKVMPPRTRVSPEKRGIKRKKDVVVKVRPMSRIREGKRTCLLEKEGCKKRKERLKKRLRRKNYHKAIKSRVGKGEDLPLKKKAGVEVIRKREKMRGGKFSEGESDSVSPRNSILRIKGGPSNACRGCS